MTVATESAGQASKDIETSGLSADPALFASWVLAAVLSVVAPGLGHFYARHTRRGILWFASTILLALVVPASMGVRAPVFLLLILLWISNALSLRFGALVDAIWVVRRHPRSRRSVPQIVVVALAMIATSQLAALMLRRFAIESFKNPSGSMIPTCFVGDHFFIDKIRSPARGDLVVFPFPEHPDQKFVKRIIGMPGDTLYFRRGGHPMINGVEVPSCLVGSASYRDYDGRRTEHEGELYLEMLGDRPYLTFYDAAVPRSDEGPYTVKAGEVFVVGDNRRNAHDSRMWYRGQGGGVPLPTVIGLPFVVWLAMNDHGVDWSREGVDLRTLVVPPSLGDIRPDVDRCVARLRGTDS